MRTAPPVQTAPDIEAVKLIDQALENADALYDLVSIDPDYAPIPPLLKSAVIEPMAARAPCWFPKIPRPQTKKAVPQTGGNGPEIPKTYHSRQVASLRDFGRFRNREGISQ